jgi:hypothetical protein
MQQRRRFVVEELRRTIIVALAVSSSFQRYRPGNIGRTYRLAFFVRRRVVSGPKSIAIPKSAPDRLGITEAHDVCVCVRDVFGVHKYVCMYTCTRVCVCVLASISPSCSASIFFFFLSFRPDDRSPL